MPSGVSVGGVDVAASHIFQFTSYTVNWNITVLKVRTNLPVWTTSEHLIKYNNKSP